MATIGGTTTGSVDSTNAAGGAVSPGATGIPGSPGGGGYTGGGTTGNFGADLAGLGSDLLSSVVPGFSSFSGLFGTPSQPASPDNPVPTSVTGGAPEGPFQPVSRGGIVSHAPVQQHFDTLSNQFDTMLNNPDPYASMFNDLISKQQANNAANEANAIASGTASKANQENQLNNQETAALSALAARGETSGASRYLPGYQQGLTEGVKNQYNMKFQALDQAEKLAIAQAHAARNNADTKLLQENLSYLRQIQQQKMALAQQAWKEYTFSNLSAAQAANLGLNRDKFNLAQRVASGGTFTTQPNFFQSIGNLFSGNPSTKGTQKFLGTPTFSIGGQNVSVGSIITNSKGQSGTVNADGTITPL